MFFKKIRELEKRTRILEFGSLMKEKKAIYHCGRYFWVEEASKHPRGEYDICMSDNTQSDYLFSGSLKDCNAIMKIFKKNQFD